MNGLSTPVLIPFSQIKGGAVKRYSSITLPQGFTVDPIEDSAVYGLKSLPVIVSE